MGEGNVFNLSTGGQDGVPQGTYPPNPRYLPPIQVRMGEGYPKVPPPAKVPTPPSRSGQGWRGTPRYLPPVQVRVPQGTYTPPAKVPTPHPGPDREGDRGYPKVPTARPLPRYLHPPPSGIGQHIQYLICCGRYASCVQAGGRTFLSIHVYYSASFSRSLSDFQ